MRGGQRTQPHTAMKSALLSVDNPPAYIEKDTSIMKRYLSIVV